MDPDTTIAVCRLFDFGTPRGAPTAVSGGLSHLMWRFETDRGVFAVKEMNRDYDRADYIDWFARAFSLEMAALRAGVPMPRPVPVSGTGRCIGELPRGEAPSITVRAHEWVDGEKLENGRIYSLATSSRLAAMLAQIHSLGMTADVEVSDVLRIYGEAHWRGRVEQAEAIAAHWAAHVRAVLPALAALEAYLATAHNDGSPAVLCHRDADMKNVLRSPDGDLLLVDWDAAGPANPRQDLANHALVWAGLHVGDPDPGIAHAFVEAYPFVEAYRRAGGIDEPFRASDLAELVSLRLGWFEFNLRRALGERARDEADRQAGIGVILRNGEQLPRFARSLDRWLAALGR